MTIPPAQPSFQVANTLPPVLPGGTSLSGVNPRGKAGSAPTAETQQALIPPPSLSTDVQIDDHHQVYYEFEEGEAKSVMFEIPPEALRNIAESLKMPPQLLEGGISTLDVKS
jgi:hypothetical protein